MRSASFNLRRVDRVVRVHVPHCAVAVVQEAMLACDWSCLLPCVCATGGDLCLVNLPGYGVDAFLTLRRLDTAGWREQLDTDEAAAGSQVAVGAALTMQQQLQKTRVKN